MELLKSKNLSRKAQVFVYSFFTERRKGKPSISSNLSALYPSNPQY
ncbi:hypothetical protein BPO_0825 [Bergeyella porcorum]|uniref:Uncharacterized protein n=1 Tax=Bergeyella porcorum TaxID=1735111 RepID=A0AAU0EYV1_9FLAO